MYVVRPYTPHPPADGAGSDTVSLHGGMNKHDSLHQEVGHCKSLVVACGNPGGREGERGTKMLVSSSDNFSCQTQR